MTKPKRTASPFKIVSGTNDPVFRAIGAHHRAAKDLYRSVARRE
jgi:hypothetical protein